MLVSATVTFWRWLIGRPASLTPLPSTAACGEERRVWLRYAAALNVRCGEVGGETEDAVAAEICDVSRGGIQMFAPRRFEPGALLSVELPSSDGTDAMAVLVYVLRAQPHGEREWKMGCRFSSELNEYQLSVFDAPRTRSSSPDSRGGERLSCNAKAFYQRVNDPAELPWSARLLNIAVGGMALLVPEPVAIGELLSAELRDADGRSVVTILACVVHTQNSPEGQIVGCNFIRELSSADVEALCKSESAA